MDEELFVKIPVHCNCGGYKTYVYWADVEELISVHFVLRCPLCQHNITLSWNSLGELQVGDSGLKVGDSSLVTSGGEEEDVASV